LVQQNNLTGSFVVSYYLFISTHTDSVVYFQN
jgi:hypothetical protein